MYLGLVVGEKHVYKENGLSTRPLHIIHLLVFKSIYIASYKQHEKIVNTKIWTNMVIKHRVNFESFFRNR